MPEEHAEHTEKIEKKAKRNWFARHKVLTAVIVLVGLGIIGASENGNNNPTNASSNNSPTISSSSTAPTQPATPGLNQQANDGKLGFTVTSFKCGISEIDQPGDTTGDFTATNGAPYCEMSLAIKGISDTSQNFDNSTQYVYANGKQYSVDSSATIYANSANNNCMELPTINPDTSITCTLAFDVPAGVTPTYAMLHDSSFSDGVKVNL